MRIIEPSFTIHGDVDGDAILRNIEKFSRVCYKSENLINIDSAKGFVAKILQSGHESVIEHEKISVTIICDRGVTHEIVRHRIASYSQESTRYCNYAKNKFGNEITVIRPYFWKSDSEAYKIWHSTMVEIEKAYLKLIEIGTSPQEARSILPNSLKTEIVVTMNLREWRHFFKLRTASAAHPQMRQISVPMLKRFKELISVVFDDIKCDFEY